MKELDGQIFEKVFMSLLREEEWQLVPYFGGTLGWINRGPVYISAIEYPCGPKLRVCIGGYEWDIPPEVSKMLWAVASQTFSRVFEYTDDENREAILRYKLSLI